MKKNINIQLIRKKHLKIMNNNEENRKIILTAISQLYPDDTFTDTPESAGPFLDFLGGKFIKLIITTKNEEKIKKRLKKKITCFLKLEEQKRIKIERKIHLDVMNKFSSYPKKFTDTPESAGPLLDYVDVHLSEISKGKVYDKKMESELFREIEVFIKKHERE